MTNQKDVENHSFELIMNQNTKILMLGTFPTAKKNRGMEFYYSNYSRNDMWRILGNIFNRNFVVSAEAKFDEEKIRSFLNEVGIGMYDVVKEASRKKEGASVDSKVNFLQATDIKTILKQNPNCTNLCTVGVRTAKLLCKQFKNYGAQVPKLGEGETFNFEGKNITIYCMPSTSKANTSPLFEKIEKYKAMFKKIERFCQINGDI